MARTKDDARVRFTDGAVAARDVVLVASQLVALEEEYEHSRIFTLKNGAWMHFDVDAVVWSVCVVQKPKRSFFCMGRDGLIDVSVSGQGHTETIADAGVGRGKLGYLHQMREIGGKLYVCGGSGQVYRRQSEGWVHFDDGVLDRKGGVRAIDLYSISGTSEKDIYSVGKKGLLFRYDGKSWTRLDSPTPHDLNYVRCVSPSEVYICGNDGSFFKGRLDKWESYSRPDLNEEFWSVEIFEGVPYLAATSGLYKFDGKKVEKVETKLNPSPGGYHLNANDGVLWSFGENHLCFFDGKKWTYVKHPDNPE
jgi:hypothetical protein